MTKTNTALTVTPKLHPATVKKAENANVILSFDSKRVQWKASSSTIPQRHIVAVEAKQALADLLTILSYEDKSEEGIRVQQQLIDGSHGDYVAVFQTARSTEIARDPELKDLIETLNEMDSEEIAELRPSTSGGVVPDIYKKRYAASGDATTCGDWLALLLNQHCQTLDEKGKTLTDLDRVEAIAIANGVEAARVDRLGTQTNGWQGRYRMTVRNMLTKVVASKGYCLIPEGVASEDTEVQAPAEWMAEHAPKPKETGTKRAKAAPTPSDTKPETDDTK